MVGRLCACLAEVPVVLDIGVNVGFYAVPFGMASKRVHGKVYAFEPVRSNFERLQQQIRLNELEETVSACHNALGEEDGVVAMLMENTGSAATGNAVLARAAAAPFGTAESVPITTLTNACERLHIGACRLIKIDVEGAELMVLRGGAGFLEKMPAHHLRGIQPVLD